MDNDCGANTPHNLLLLGVGQTARALLKALDDPGSILQRPDIGSIYGTTRNGDRVADLTALGVQPVLMGAADSARELLQLACGAYVLVSFPPDGVSDRALAELVSGAAKIVYISSTGVYGQTSGKINEESAVDSSQKARLQAEEIWRASGAIVLRAPGLYSGVDSMLKRITGGDYRIPGDGHNYVSRIHLYDLAQIIMAAFLRAARGVLYVTGDNRPATHLEVVQWLCQKYQLPLPQFAPLEQVHQTLRGNRQIDNSRVLTDLSVTLRYPTFVEGFES